MKNWFKKSELMFLLSRVPTIPFRIRRCWYLAYNRLLFRISGVKVGHGMTVYNNIYLKKARGSDITIGNSFTFTSGEAVNPLCRNIRGCIYAAPNARIEIGDNVGISSACIWAKESITIGNNVKIGGDCLILDTDCHNLDYRVRSGDICDEYGCSIDSKTAVSLPIVIEHDVLIGTRCIILKGVTIGARSVIGSGSVVTKDIPADCIAAGNPAKVIKSINNING